MKTFKKKIATLGMALVTAVSAAIPMSTSAAATYENWRPDYAPTSGTFYASKTAAIVQGLC